MSEQELTEEAEKLMRIAEMATGPKGFGVSANFVIALTQLIQERERRAVESKVNQAVMETVLYMDESDNEVVLPPGLAGEHMKWEQGFKAGVNHLASLLKGGAA